MSNLRITVAQGGDDASLDAIIKAYRFHDYRRYPSIKAKDGAKYLRASTMETLARDGAQGWFAYQGDVPVGFASVSPLDWDSNYFGLRMARLSVMVTKKETDQVFVVADKLLSIALRGAYQKRFQHLSLRVDIEDIGLVHALEKNGFRLMDTIVAYTFHMGRNHMPEISPKYDLRLYQPGDFASVLNIADACFKGYPNRFTLDPHIPKEQAEAFYFEWAKNSCQGKFSDEMLVAERRGQVVGFLTYRVNPSLRQYTGVQIITDGLSGCYPLRFNAFLDLLREATRRHLDIVDAIEAESHLSNTATPIYYQQLNYNYARAKYSFHLFMDS